MTFSIFFCFVYLAATLSTYAATVIPVSSFTHNRTHNVNNIGAVVKIYIKYPDIKILKPFTIRGEGLPGLSWDHGLELDHLEDNLWGIEIYNITVPKGLNIQFKTLLKDQLWQQGGNFEIDIIKSGNNAFTYYPWFRATSGTIKVYDNMHSSELNNTRSVAIYLPPKYFENPFSVIKNVLLMNDGNNIFNLTCPTCCPNGCWFCGETLDELIINGIIRDDLLVAGVYNTALRMEEYTYSKDPQFGGGKADLYLDFLESTIIPFIEKTFRVQQEQQVADNPNSNVMRDKYSLGILGSSLGGLLSCYAGQTRSNVYKYAGCMSSSFWWNNKDFNSVILKNGTVKTKSSSIFYLDSGNEGPGKDDEMETISVRNSMEMLGKKLNFNLFYYLDRGGSHNELFWGKRFFHPMVDFYKNSEKS
jgi:predicted alpha/beta superfamily hydrolase